MPATGPHLSSPSLGSAIKNVKMDNEPPTKYARFDKDQARILEDQASRSDTPSEETIIQLARQFEVPVKKVADWFVNYRYRRGSKAKEKKASGDEQSARDDSIEPESSQADGKGRRFAKLTKIQVKVLEQELLNGDSPSRDTRERLALEVDAPVQKVSEWFSNRKQRMKKRALEDSMVLNPSPKRLASDNIGSGSIRHLSIEKVDDSAIVWKPSGRSLQLDRPQPLSPVPQLPPGRNEAALGKFLRDIEDNISRLKDLRQGVIANSGRTQNAISHS